LPSRKYLPEPDTPTARAPWRGGFVLVAALTLSWGIHWPLIKVALTEIPPFTFRGIGVLVGGAALIAIAAWRGERIRPLRREILTLAWLSLFNVAIWQMLSAYGLQSIPAGRGAILAYTMPLWSVLLGALFLGEKLELAGLFALGCGLAGMALLIGDDIGVVGQAPVGALMMLGAALVWAIGTVSTKGFTWSISLSAMVGWQLLAAAVPMLSAAILFESGRWAVPSPLPAFAMIYNIVFAAVVAHLLWFKLLALYPAGIASISTLMIPVVGVVSGALILDESIGWTELLALLLVVCALASVHRPWRLLSRRSNLDQDGPGR
jgi:drug/metabolite transporter (DMT)-like permease